MRPGPDSVAGQRRGRWRSSGPRGRRLRWFIVLAATSASCSGNREPGSPAHGDSGPGDAGGSCPTGSIVGMDGRSCLPVGIQGCAEDFLDEAGICRPDAGDCEPGTLPGFADGCVPVGVPGCAAEFREDGWCKPSVHKCSAERYALPGVGCISIDGESGCGADPWGSHESPDDLHVDPAAPAGGTGTRSHPFSTITEALAAKPQGVRIVLAAGIYDEALKIGTDVQIVGRCASKVTLRGSGPTTFQFDATVWFTKSATATLRGVTIEPPPGAMGVIVSAADATLEEVVVRHADGVGILAARSFATLRLRRSLVEDTIAGSALGRGLNVQDGATALVDESAVVANLSEGVFVGGSGTMLTMSGSLVEDTRPTAADGKGGFGLTVIEGAHSSVTGSAFVHNTTAGVITGQPGSSLDVSHSVITDSTPQPADGLASGAAVQPGGRLTVDGTVLLDNQWAGVLGTGAAAELVLTHSYVARSLPRETDQVGGVGVSLHDGVVAQLDGNAIVDNHAIGVFATREVILDAKRNLVAGTAPDPSDLSLGRGVNLQEGARATLQSNAIVDNTGVGLFAGGSGTELTATENVVADTRPEAAGASGGRGIDIESGAHVTFDRNVVSRNREIGLFAAERDTEVTARGNLISETLPQASDEQFGFGVACSGRGVLHLESSVVRGNHVAGVFVASATARVQDTLIEDVPTGSFTVESPKATYENVGDGLIAAFDSNVTVAGLTVRRYARAGILFSSSGGSVAGSNAAGGRFGIVVQGSPTPLLEANNVWGGTESDLVMGGDLPVPDAPESLPQR